MSKWYIAAYETIQNAYHEALDAGKSPEEVMRAINSAYPFGYRMYTPYKQWLRARRDFCRLKKIPLSNAKLKCSSTVIADDSRNPYWIDNANEPGEYPDGSSWRTT